MTEPIPCSDPSLSDPLKTCELPRGHEGPHMHWWYNQPTAWATPKRGWGDAPEATDGT